VGLHPPVFGVVVLWLFWFWFVVGPPPFGLCVLCVGRERLGGGGEHRLGGRWVTGGVFGRDQGNFLGLVRCEFLHHDRVGGGGQGAREGPWSLLKPGSKTITR